MKQRLLATLIISSITLSGVLAGPAHAQGTQPMGTNAPSLKMAAAKPASQDDINTYSMMGAVNICILNSSKVSFDVAVPAAAEMVASVIIQKHGGVIAGANNNQPLSSQMVLNGSVINVVARVQEACMTKLGVADQKKVKDLLAQVEQASQQPQPAGQPAAGTAKPAAGSTKPTAGTAPAPAGATPAPSPTVPKR